MGAGRAGPRREESASASPIAKMAERRALLVHAHSEPASFVTAMRNTIAGALIEEGWAVDNSDLYAMRFNPVISANDFPRRRDVKHLAFALEQRHGYETRQLAPEILQEVDKIQACSLIVFTFPVFWFDVPAILKGWIDRVFLSGPFYGGRRIYGRGGLSGKRATAAFSLGGREHMFGPNALHGDLENGMLRHFLQGTLGYVGFDVIEPFVAYHVPYIDDADRARLLDRLKHRMRNIEALPVMPMPDLDRFDRTFKPILGP